MTRLKIRNKAAGGILHRSPVYGGFYLNRKRLSRRVLSTTKIPLYRSYHCTKTMTQPERSSPMSTDPTTVPDTIEKVNSTIDPCTDSTTVQPIHSTGGNHEINPTTVQNFTRPYRKTKKFLLPTDRYISLASYQTLRDVTSDISPCRVPDYLLCLHVEVNG